jgi:hypothetical protein
MAGCVLTGPRQVREVVSKIRPVRMRKEMTRTARAGI